MGGGSIYDAVRRRTTEALGFPVNLHRFRHAAGNLWSISDPVNVRGVKDLLGQTDFGTTEKHYMGAQSVLQDGHLQRCFAPMAQGNGGSSPWSKIPHSSSFSLNEV